MGDCGNQKISTVSVNSCESKKDDFQGLEEEEDGAGGGGNEEEESLPHKIIKRKNGKQK